MRKDKDGELEQDSKVVNGLVLITAEEIPDLSSTLGLDQRL